MHTEHSDICCLLRESRLEQGRLLKSGLQRGGLQR